MKKILLLKSAFGILLLFNLSSCVNDEDMVANDPVEIVSVPSEVTTSCQIFGMTEVDRGGTYSYSAQTNISNPRFSWSIASGDASIISGGRSSVVKISVGNNCSNVTLKVTIRGDEVCSETISLTCSGSGSGDNGCLVVPQIRAINMITGEHRTFCSNKHFAASVLNLPEGYTVEWRITPSIPNSAGSMYNWYVEFTDTPQYSRYTVTATLKCPNGQPSGSSSVTLNQTDENCDWVPI